MIKKLPGLSRSIPRSARAMLDARPAGSRVADGVRERGQGRRLSFAVSLPNGTDGA